jgi:hypothetical protein
MDMEKLMGGTWSEGRFFFPSKMFWLGFVSHLIFYYYCCLGIYFGIGARTSGTSASVRMRPDCLTHVGCVASARTVQRFLLVMNLSAFFFPFRFGYEERRGSAVSASATSPHSINSGTWQWPTSTKHLRVGATGRLPFWVTFHLHYYFVFKKKKLPFSPRLVEQISREKKTSVNAPCWRVGQRDLATHVPSPSHYPLRNPFLFTSPLADRNTSSPTDLQSTASLSLSLSVTHSPSQ